MEICCADTEGILGVKLTHNTTMYESVIICNYLPPSNSKYGRDCEGFFTRLLMLSYEFCEVDILCYCGFNARTGCLSDNNLDQSPIPERMNIDKTLQ